MKSSPVPAGYLNDPRQAHRVVLQGGDPRKRCRWCSSQLVRAPRGAIVCSGYCDVPSPALEEHLAF